MSNSNEHYALPNPSEQSEQARLDLQHQIWLLGFGGSLTAPCLPGDFAPKTILEIGCGSGAWVTAYAAEHPDAQIVATDVTPPTIASPPSNVSFVAHNAEQKWNFEVNFDYIHVRLLTLAIRDWQAFFKKCFAQLKPGGWLELADASVPYAAENPAANCQNSMFLRVGYLYYQALQTTGIDMMVAHHHLDRLKLEGFVDVRQEVCKWPLNGLWAQEERLKTMGRMVGENWAHISRAILPKVYKAMLSMDEGTVNAIVEEMLNECRDDRDKKLFFPMDITIARKPQ